jgi:hypothetical protein
VLGKFLSLPEIERNKKMMDLEGFLKTKISKTQKLLMKQIDENQKKFRILITNFSKNLDCNMTGVIEKKLYDVERKLRSMKIQAQEETENGSEAVNETTNAGHVVDT